MGSLAVFGITNDGANLVVSLLILFLLVFWLALIYWTYADARRRIDDRMLVGCATAAALFPFAGTIVYMIVRPPEYIDDRRERELEIAAAEARLAGIEHLTCPYCAFDIERSFLRCPSCLQQLKEPCGTCGKPLDPRWKLCPYCEAEIGQAPPQPRRKERRRERPAAAQASEAEPERRRKRARTAGEGRKAAPASDNGEPTRPVSAASVSQPEAAPQPDGAPAAKKDRVTDEDGRPQRPREGSRPQRPANSNRTPRPGEPAQRQRSSSGARKKRPGAPAPERPVSDEVTSEQPVPRSRPRNRPPSAG